MLAIGERRVALIDERHDLVAQVVQVAAGAVELRNCEPPSEVHASTNTTIASGHSPAANIASMRSTIVGSNARRAPATCRPGRCTPGSRTRRDSASARERARRRATGRRTAAGAPGRRAGCRPALGLHHELVQRAGQRALPRGADEALRLRAAPRAPPYGTAVRARTVGADSPAGYIRFGSAYPDSLR